MCQISKVVVFRDYLVYATTGKQQVVGPKLTHFIVKYGAGSYALDPEDQSVVQAAWRAQLLSGYRILVSAYQDPHDMADVGVAWRRSEKLCELLYQNGIDVGRLIVEFPTVNFIYSEWSRRAEVQIYPSISSLNGDDDYLTYSEVNLLIGAMSVVHSRTDKFVDLVRERILECSPDELMRIIGFKSLMEWENSTGRNHPFYNK